MRLTQLLTTTEAPDPEQRDLLAHAGYTHRVGDGLYTILPLGQRVLGRIVAIVRDELTRTGAEEVTMPLLQPAALWERPRNSGQTRAEAFGRQLFRVSGDGKDGLVLAPSHEESAALLAAACIRDGRQLRHVVFQIQPRFRDQVCLRDAGLLQSREFVMADAYSFHSDRASLCETYVEIKEALLAVVARCGIQADVVSADSGAMGGDESEELVAALPSVASVLAVRCTGCGYAASVDVAEFRRGEAEQEALRALRELPGGDEPSGAEQAAQSRFSPARRLAVKPFIAGNRIVLAVFPADLRLGAQKLARAIGEAGENGDDLRPATAVDLEHFGVGREAVFLVDTPRSVLVVADEAVRDRANFIFPSKQQGHVLVDINPRRDFRVDVVSDIAIPEDDATCVRCGASLQPIRGVEIAHLFKLGSGYAAAAGAVVGNEGGVPRPLEMGSYGLGLTRLMAAVVEVGRDERGIVWPRELAPYHAAIVPSEDDADAAYEADRLYDDLAASELEVLLADGDGSPEEKLRRLDLLGIPLAIVVSSRAQRAPLVGIRERGSLAVDEVAADVRGVVESRWKTTAGAARPVRPAVRGGATRR